jgi:hypothetical protein
MQLDQRGTAAAPLFPRLLCPLFLRCYGAVIPLLFGNSGRDPNIWNIDVNPGFLATGTAYKKLVAGTARNSGEA